VIIAFPGVRVIPSTQVEWTETGHGRVKTLYEQARPSIRLTLEQWAPASPVRRTLADGCEEIFVSEGSLEYSSAVGESTYVVLSPHGAELLRAGVRGCGLVRLSYGDSGDHAKPQFAQRYGEFLWHQIPARGENDPGSRTAELSRSQSGGFVTTLLEANAGWILAEHDHPVDAVSYCLRGGGVLEVAGVQYPRVPHQVALIPSGTRHSFRAGPEGAALLIFVFAPGFIA
jgi:quercetin dioxygenase-like cupin family protein